ncbi:MAG: DUF4159 domain-containing protein [Kiritimatiellia bacterium]
MVKDLKPLVSGAWSRIRAELAFERVIPSVLCLPLGVAGAFLARTAVLLCAIHYPDFLAHYPEFQKLYSPDAVPMPLFQLAIFTGWCAAMFTGISLAGLKRSALTLELLRKGYAIFYCFAAVYTLAVLSVTGSIESAESIDLGDQRAMTVFYWRWNWLWPMGLAVLSTAFLHVTSSRRRVINLYTHSSETEPARGDRILENIRTHGRDPLYRKSTIASSWIHIAAIVLPILFSRIGCIKPYRAPFGGGKPRVQMVRVVQKEKKKKKKQYILRRDSAIIFHPPDLDDSKVFKEVEEATMMRYQAQASAVHGKLGDGEAATPGWQHGFKDGVVRFIRLEYRGEAWDDGMDSVSRADMNFLDRFRELSGGMRTARKSESHPIRLLKKYPKDQSPPFVYMTGSGHIRVSRQDIEILREFLIKHGSMLIADCGSRRWHRSFRHFASRLFPGSPLRIIADDDPIFQMPFQFPNGAPPLWHHGGKQAMGIKHKGRWVVFYHPGDLNDAWKTGHSGIDPQLAQGAFEMGVNLVYYSFIHYYEETAKYRK